MKDVESQKKLDESKNETVRKLDDVFEETVPPVVVKAVKALELQVYAEEDAYELHGKLRLSKRSLLGILFTVIGGIGTAVIRALLAH